MDEFLREIHMEVLKYWILGQHSNQMQMSLQHNEVDTIIITTKHSYSEVVFYPVNVIEFRVTNTKTKEAVFYLHFQMNTMKHAIELYQEMIDVIKTLVSKPPVKVLLSCTGGLTTGFFSQQIQEVANMFHLNYQIDAVSYNELFKVGDNYDIILLAPQISYMLAKTKEILKDKIVLAIPSKIFAMYDSHGALELIKTQIKTKEIKQEEMKQESLWNETEIKNTNDKILTISLFRDFSKVYINYRLYDNNEQNLLQNEIIKAKLTIEDIYDVIDFVMAKTDDIKVIGISTPGVIQNGMIMNSGIDGFENVKLAELIQQRYPIKIVLGNDVNTAALGIYKKLEKYQNLCVLFQPVGCFAGAGIIINGSLITGISNATGEIQYLPLHLDQTQVEMSKTPENCVELVAKIITTLVAIVNPEAIIVLCKLIPDMDLLKEEITKYLPKVHIPELIKVEDLTEEILTGQMLLCKK